MGDCLVGGLGGGADYPGAGVGFGLKETTKIKLAIEAIEYYQRRFVFEANAFKRLRAPHGEKEAKKFDRLQESKEYLQELLKVKNG